MAYNKVDIRACGNGHQPARLFCTRLIVGSDHLRWSSVSIGWCPCGYDLFTAWLSLHARVVLELQQLTRKETQHYIRASMRKRAKTVIMVPISATLTATTLQLKQHALSHTVFKYYEFKILCHAR